MKIRRLSYTTVITMPELQGNVSSSLTHPFKESGGPENASLSISPSGSKARITIANIASFPAALFVLVLNTII